jgi:hypothetical protein
MPLVLLALTAGYGAEQNAQKQDAEARFVAIEQELASVQEYLQAQSRSASELAKALDESEKAGFTYGINPNSRKVLLKGWRDFSGNLQKDVPGAKPGPGKR